MSDTLDLRGILPALITPFTADGSAVDEAALRVHVAHLVDAGSGGIVVAGSTGEFTSLTLEEREALLETVLDAVGGRVPVVAHTGAMTTAAAIRLSEHAATAGAACVMVVLPYYEPLTRDEVTGYLGDIASAVDLPLMYYNLPTATGVSLSVDEVGELARRGVIASVKDTGGDAAWFDQLLGRYGDDLQVLNGGDTLTFAALCAGAPAAVWGAANIFPELAIELYDTVAVQHDLVRGRELWARMRGLLGYLEAAAYTARVKAASELMGVTTGPLRRPLAAPSDSEMEQLRGWLRDAGLR